MHCAPNRLMFDSAVSVDNGISHPNSPTQLGDACREVRGLTCELRQCLPDDLQLPLGSRPEHDVRRVVFKTTSSCHARGSWSIEQLPRSLHAGSDITVLDRFVGDQVDSPSEQHGQRILQGEKTRDIRHMPRQERHQQIDIRSRWIEIGDTRSRSEYIHALVVKPAAKFGDLVLAVGDKRQHDFDLYTIHHRLSPTLPGHLPTNGKTSSVSRRNCAIASPRVASRNVNPWHAVPANRPIHAAQISGVPIGPQA